MSDNKLEEEYKKALYFVNNAPKSSSNISNKTKLEFYGLYKQISKGDNNTSKPSVFNLVESAKWYKKNI
jgi:acyl-CoA-binding protein